jgi:putative YhdH/YhfP family quinone oxidoreductase
MSDTTFRALVVREEPDGRFTRRIETRALSELPAGEVTVRVAYSALNYKDALSAIGNRGVTRDYPHTPGIDATGHVEESASEAFRAGDPVLVTGYDLGMNTDGGFGQYIRVPADWIVALPRGLGPREAMILGTAGLTAGLSVHKVHLLGVTPDRGDVLVTGATGGVGSLAIAIFSRLGYRVVASTGKAEAREYLTGLGAAEVISREAVVEGAERPVLSPRWAAVVDTVGGETLSAAVKATRYGGVVASCGLVGSPRFCTTVYPFILRDANLVGIASAECDMALRLDIWRRLAGEWRPHDLEAMARECTLDQLDAEIGSILQGGQTGRVIVNMA